MWSVFSLCASLSRNVKFCNPAAERNKGPILSVLERYIPPPLPDHSTTSGSRVGFCLEVSSGSGQHIVHFARRFPHLVWQPSEYDVAQLPSISAYVRESRLPNLLPPIPLDVQEDPSTWGGSAGPRLADGSVDCVVNINMMHITEFSCTQGLFRGCGRLLKTGGFLFSYGPYSLDGTITPESNVRFHAMLRRENPQWGLRDVQKDLIPLALQNGLRLLEMVDMPANNKVLVWVKDQIRS